LVVVLRSLVVVSAEFGSCIEKFKNALNTGFKPLYNSFNTVLRSFVEIQNFPRIKELIEL
jgi:hypothetical protein